MAKLTYDNPLMLAGQLKELFLEDQHLKENLFEGWLRNIHFLNGQQALEWDQYQTRFRNVPLTNRKTSRPHIYITNEIEPIVRTLVSFLTRNKPKAIVYPSDFNDDESVRRAKIAEMVQKSTWDIDHEYDRYMNAAYILFTMGTVFRKDYWDSSARGQIHMPPSEPLLMGNAVDPQMDNAAPESIGVKKTSNEEMENDYPAPQHWGDMKAAILSPFQMAVDFQVTEFTDADWVMEYSIQKVDWIKEQFSQRSPGFTGRIDEVKPEDSFGRALEMDLEMRFQSPTNTGKKPRMQKVAVLMEFYQAPKADMPWNKMNPAKPLGRQVIATRSVTLYDGPSLYNWHPYTCGGYEPFIGRFWKKALIEQLTMPQRRLNEINGAILENAQTMANPQWLIPKGTVQDGVISGKHGLVIGWTPQPHGNAPQKQQGVPLPQQYFNERAMIIDTMVRIAGSNAVMSGVPPTGVHAASALQLLLENAQSQHGPLINEWELFIERSQTKKIQNFQRFCREPRSDITRYVKRIDKNATNLDIDAICGDDIEDEVTVSIEAGSSIPKSQAARQAQLMEFAKAGILGDMQDPVTRQQFLSQFGITEFDQTTGAEWDKIQWENGRMLKAEEPSPSENDIHEMHLPHHISLTQRPSYIESASPETKMICDAHIAWHKEQIQMKMMQSMPPPQEMGPPEGQGPEGMPMPPGMPPLQ